MGLDMYLEKYPRNHEPRVVYAVEEFYSWIKEGRQECSFEKWCGISEENLPDINTMMELLRMIHTSYYAWDDQKKYPQEQVHEQVGYWRKANAIHNWFVEYIQDGEDDCLYHRPVTRDDLERLVEKCKMVIYDHSLADKILPVAHGFFFGSYDYDEWYFADIEKTYQLCMKLIKEFDFEHYDLYYRSSW